MFGHLGFSYVGLIFLVLLIVPNILWSRNPPEDYDNSFEHGILMLLERIGQVGCFSVRADVQRFQFCALYTVDVMAGFLLSRRWRSTNYAGCGISKADGGRGICTAAFMEFPFRWRRCP